MRNFRSVSLAEQVAAHIKLEILHGTIVKSVPGVHKLAQEFGVHHTTAEEALQILEKEKLIQSQGTGRKRLILPTENFAPPSMSVGILAYEDMDRTVHFIQDMQHKLQDAGHVTGFASKSLQDLGMDTHRVARFIKDQIVDAWVVVAGPRGVIEWFANQPTPAFSLFGRRDNIQIASTGPNKLPALVQAVDRLIELGHRRIVMLLREEHRKPKLGVVAQTFLDAIDVHGLPTGPYNLPDWKNNPEALRRCLDSLFLITPPTALIVDETFIFNATQQHLARMGILAPENVSLICTDPDPFFDWFSPTISHIDWDSSKVVQRVVRWANNVARGKTDTRHSSVKAEFIEGGTIGPVPRAR